MEWQSDYKWRDEASCLGSDPELFFTEGTGSDALLAIEMAKKICGSCAVQAECLDYALRTNQPFGVWGGTTAEERRTMARNKVA